MKTSIRLQTAKLTQMAILVAIMLIFAFTPIGYLKFGVVEITLMVLPVAVGAITLGPAAGAFLGGLFGLTSFLQCFGISALGVFLMGISPVLTALVCVVPRILCGWLSGLLFAVLNRRFPKKTWVCLLSALSTALLNTVLFMSFLVLCFWWNPLFLSQMSAWGIATDTLWLFLVAFVGVNGIVEIAVNVLVGGAISRILLSVIRRP